ncbi:Ig-like domain-containing protein [Nitrosomonas communis]|uniref:Uncharacterized protein n=1 Tax=Nitrosomonas communis TaxID=44574 RepID=A0A1I4LR15_9PROT|nr:Ig-like domain-containing protein [Nitrosomonas communis]SFL93450.1 hypothetical protein SAMN05421863_100756 [Nitrosomonas communis]
MFRQIYESVPTPYRTQEELPAVGTGIGAFLYNPYLVEQPRLYGEEMYLLAGLFVRREQTATANHTLHLVGFTQIIRWPSWDTRHWVFDGITGEFLRDDPAIPPLALGGDLVEGADGSIWMYTAWTGGWIELNPVTMASITGSTLDKAKYGNPASIETPLVDRANNILVCAESSGVARIKIYNFTTGTWIRDIEVSGPPAQIMPESNKYAYVYCHNGIINLINYVDGRVLSALKAPAPTDTQYLTQIGSQKFAYDRFHRRLLAFQMVVNNADGSSASTIKGWYPVPLPVRIMQPIPLIAPRAGRTVPYLTRLYGDAGEPVAGVHVQGAISGVNVNIAPGITDNNGYALVQGIATAAGSAILTVSAEVITS